jgi:hypothetical protein
VRGFLDRGIEFLLIRARQKGVGGNRAWFGIWFGFTVARQLFKLVGKEPSRTERIVLRPGQSVVIRDTGELWGKAKKR